MFRPFYGTVDQKPGNIHKPLPLLNNGHAAFDKTAGSGFLCPRLQAVAAELFKKLVPLKITRPNKSLCERLDNTGQLE
jgi:hypothetical protein